MLAEHGPGDKAANDRAHNRGQEQHHQHGAGRQCRQGVHIVCGHPLFRDLPQEVLPHQPDGQRRAHHAQGEQDEGHKVSPDAGIMGTATDQFPQAAGNDKGDQDYRGELAGDEVDQPGDKAHQQD